MTIRAVQFGLGPIGSAVARAVAARDGIDLVGGVDIDPEKIGKDLGQVVGLDRPLDVPVDPALADVLKRTEADIVLHTTNSYFDLFRPQVIDILDHGLDIVSTSEEMSFPWLAHPDDAKTVDVAARKAGKTVLATGVNPGFLMDSLPLNLTAICQQVNHIAVTRVINASTRRGPFQAKIGSGMTVEAFNEKMAAGRMGHVGLPESVGMLFDTLGKTLIRYQDQVEPVVAERTHKTDYFEVEAGGVIGLKQVAQGFTDAGEFVRLTFIAALDAGDEADTINITGVPNLEVRLQGTNGDLCTVAIAINAIRRVLDAPPGLVTMRDLPLVYRF